jgi:hypothetical protein
MARKEREAFEKYKLEADLELSRAVKRIVDLENALEVLQKQNATLLVKGSTSAREQSLSQSLQWADDRIRDLGARHDFLRVSMEQISRMSSTTKLRKIALAALKGPPEVKPTIVVAEEGPDSCTIVEDGDILPPEGDCQ